jgi:hypothetical protein
VLYNSLARIDKISRHSRWDEIFLLAILYQPGCNNFLRLETLLKLVLYSSVCLLPWVIAVNKVYFSEADGRSAGEEIPRVILDTRINYRVHKLTTYLVWARSFHFHTISLKSVLILSCHLRLGAPSGLLFLRFIINTFCLYLFKVHSQLSGGGLTTLLINWSLSFLKEY